ncbi:MAG: mandelate racemase, partial [Burkholderiales bacterium]|nr:mandelate racemase [Burkholderiales bacterium]
MKTASLTYDRVRVRAVLVPLKRKIVSRVGVFDHWPMILIDLQTTEGVVGKSYLEPYLHKSPKYIMPAIEDLV